MSQLANAQCIPNFNPADLKDKKAFIIYTASKNAKANGKMNVTVDLRMNKTLYTNFCGKSHPDQLIEWPSRGLLRGIDIDTLEIIMPTVVNSKNDRWQVFESPRFLVVDQDGFTHCNKLILSQDGQSGPLNLTYGINKYTCRSLELNNIHLQCETREDCLKQIARLGHRLMEYITHPGFNPYGFFTVDSPQVIWDKVFPQTDSSWYGSINKYIDDKYGNKMSCLKYTIEKETEFAPSRYCCLNIHPRNTVIKQLKISFSSSLSNVNWYSAKLQRSFRYLEDLHMENIRPRFEHFNLYTGSHLRSLTWLNCCAANAFVSPSNLRYVNIRGSGKFHFVRRPVPLVNYLATTSCFNSNGSRMHRLFKRFDLQVLDLSYSHIVKLELLKGHWPEIRAFNCSNTKVTGTQLLEFLKDRGNKIEELIAYNCKHITPSVRRLLQTRVPRTLLDGDDKKIKRRGYTKDTKSLFDKNHFLDVKRAEWSPVLESESDMSLPYYSDEDSDAGSYISDYSDV